jgi:hypothetical protein
VAVSLPTQVAQDALLSFAAALPVAAVLAVLLVGAVRLRAVGTSSPAR